MTFLWILARQESFNRFPFSFSFNRCALAARVDSCHESRDGAIGRQFAEIIQKRIDRIQEDAPGKQVKALPVPLEAYKKRRGGKRARKTKEKFAVTEYRKLQNRMSFGVEENEASYLDSSKGMGMIGNSGKIRATTEDKRSKGSSFLLTSPFFTSVLPVLS